jgi:predicted ATP-grasp superfamily ATP-dependent carboligase
MAGPPILIAAFSGRAAAAAAHRAGFAPLVADLFADDDTCDAAAAVRRVAGDCSSGFDEASLLAALGDLADAAPEPPIGLAYGAGFEDRPALLGRLGARWPLLGNSAEMVSAVKDPFRLAAALNELGISHPRVLEADAAARGWLLKRQGGAGGGHVGAARGGEGGTYAQRRVAGRSVSALFLAGPAGISIVGFSEQWTAPSPGQPFRFGGAATPAKLSGVRAEMLTDVVDRVARRFELKGLNSIDFILGVDDGWLIEINPRLGATLDLFDAPMGGESLLEGNGLPLFAAHIAAIRGETPVRLAVPQGARALQIVYARAAVPHVPRLDWPDWIADRPQPGTAIRAGAPICTVLASAQNLDEARRLCQARAHETIQLIGLREWTTSPNGQKSA